MSPAVPIAASSAPSLDLDPSIATWGVLGALVVAMLAIDLLVFARDHTPPMREAAAWSVVWLVVAVAFGAVFWAWQGGEAGGQFFAGYLLERTLSLDNVFVFAVILAYFAVPAAVQPKVLSWGIALALVLRLALILAGAALLDTFHATFYVFGAAAALHRLEARAPRGRGGGARAQPRTAPAPAAAAGQAARRGLRRRRDDRPRLRGRLDPGDLRRDLRAVRGLRGQRLRRARAARPLLPAGGDDGPLRLPLPRSGADPRLHRHEDAADRRLAPADLAVAGGHRRRARRDRRALAARASPKGRAA